MKIASNKYVRKTFLFARFCLENHFLCCSFSLHRALRGKAFLFLYTRIVAEKFLPLYCFFLFRISRLCAAYTRVLRLQNPLPHAYAILFSCPRIVLFRPSECDDKTIRTHLFCRSFIVCIYAQALAFYRFSLGYSVYILFGLSQSHVPQTGRYVCYTTMQKGE